MSLVDELCRPRGYTEVGVAMKAVRKAWGDFLAWRSEKTQNVMPRNPLLRRKPWTQACLPGVALITFITMPMTG